MVQQQQYLHVVFVLNMGTHVGDEGGGEETPCSGPLVQSPAQVALEVHTALLRHQRQQLPHQTLAIISLS